MVITLVLLSNCSSTDSPGPTTATEQVVAPSFPEELPAVAEPSTDRWNFLRDVHVKNVVFENLVQIEPFIRFNGADEIYLNNQISDVKTAVEIKDSGAIAFGKYKSGLESQVLADTPMVKKVSTFFRKMFKLGYEKFEDSKIGNCL